MPLFSNKQTNKQTMTLEYRKLTKNILKKLNNEDYLTTFSFPDVRWQLMKQNDVLPTLNETPTAPLLPVRNIFMEIKSILKFPESDETLVSPPRSSMQYKKLK